ARTIGIAVDKRRKNTNRDTFYQNVQRLTEYQKGIKIWSSRRQAKEAGVKQHKGVVMPLVKKEKTVDVITPAEVGSI
ncbi:RL13A, partial [Enterospora canceri]